MPDHNAESPFVPLPIGGTQPLRVLGPPPAEAGTAVELLAPLGRPLGVLQPYLAALCDLHGRIAQPAEVLLVLDAASLPPAEQVPPGAPLLALRRFAESGGGATIRGFEWFDDLLQPAASLAPLFYCRKRHAIFAARSPRTGARLSAVPEKRALDAGEDLLAAALLCWDGPSSTDPPRIYAGRSGTSALGEVASFDQLVLDQGQVVHWVEAHADDLLAHQIRRDHTCSDCAESARCYPRDGGYTYATDRLQVISAAELPLTARPLGEWTLAEAAALTGGAEAASFLSGRTELPPPLAGFRARQAERIAAAGPGLALAGESDGSALLEAAWLKLRLMTHVFEQLTATWRSAAGPHLCWSDETVRVAWRAAAAAPASAWGLTPILRFAGLAPQAVVAGGKVDSLPYPPIHSHESLLAAHAREASRGFGQPLKASVHVKKARNAPAGRECELLLEDVDLAPAAFVATDVVEITGEGWQAVCRPAPGGEGDGNSIALAGIAYGDGGKLRSGETISGCTARWYPRFGEAVDLHALGLLLLETLLATDERPTARLRPLVAEQLDELARRLAALPADQREQSAGVWIAQHCDEDVPSSIWTRRNLLYRAADRNATRLDAFPPRLWHAVITFAVRLASQIEGFSFCASRARDCERGPGETPLPLLELRGLTALVEDRLFGRDEAARRVRSILEG